MTDSRNSRRGRDVRQPGRCTCWACTLPSQKIKTLRERAEARNPDEAAVLGAISFGDWHDMFCTSDCGIERGRDSWEVLEREYEAWCEENEEFCSSSVEPLRVPLGQAVRVR
jgi:hypothetical protein